MGLLAWFAIVCYQRCCSCICTPRTHSPLFATLTLMWQSIRVHGADDDHCQLHRAGTGGTFAGRWQDPSSRKSGALTIALSFFLFTTSQVARYRTSQDSRFLCFGRKSIAPKRWRGGPLRSNSPNHGRILMWAASVMEAHHSLRKRWQYVVSHLQSIINETVG